MRLRHLLPISVLALGALVAPACSSDDGSDTASGNSNDRDTTSAPEDSTASDDSGTPSEETPDLSDLAEGIPGVGDLNDCVKQAAAFGSLYLEALAGGDGAKNAQQQAEELKAVLPDDLHDEIDVISEAIGTVAEKGIMEGSEAMGTEEYKTAEATVSKYLDQECGTGGGG